MSASSAKTYFSSEHAWAMVAGTQCRIGITDYAQEQLGEILYADLPQKGQEVSAGEVFMEIESNKVIAEVHAPVSGTIEEVNDALEEAPELISQSPRQEGWLVSLSLKDPGELQGLMTQAEYDAFVK